MFHSYLIQTTARIVFILFVLLSVQYNSYAITLTDYIVVAEGRSKSSGNEVLKEIENGRDFKGMSKEEVVAAIGEPWQKDTTPVKARHNEKWIYSCETNKGLTYDCVFLYFMGGRVINVGTNFNTPGEY